jgi:alcohol dehydrogenase class IV
MPTARMHVPVEVAEPAVAHGRQVDADCCVAIGGGSTVELGKATALSTGLPATTRWRLPRSAEPAWAPRQRGCTITCATPRRHVRLPQAEAHAVALPHVVDEVMVGTYANPRPVEATVLRDLITAMV